MGLRKDSMESLDLAPRGDFLHLPVSEARSMLDRISGRTPCTSIHNELPEKEKESSLKQEESFDSQITTTQIPRFSYQFRTINTPKSSKGRRNSTFENPC
jgi:hypothetical protein